MQPARAFLLSAAAGLQSGVHCLPAASAGITQAASCALISTSCSPPAPQSAHPVQELQPQGEQQDQPLQPRKQQHYWEQQGWAARQHTQNGPGSQYSAACCAPHHLKAVPWQGLMCAAAASSTMPAQGLQPARTQPLTLCLHSTTLASRFTTPVIMRPYTASLMQAGVWTGDSISSPHQPIALSPMGHQFCSIHNERTVMGEQSERMLTDTQQEADQQKAAAESVWALPNMLSLARLASAPFIAALILHANWPWAFALTAAAGATDWADGALARRLGQSSVLGSYLDPLADKVLVCTVVGALALQGALPAWVAGIVIGRDVGIVAAVFIHRWRTLGWRTRGVTRTEFFRVQGSGRAPFMKPLFISKANTVLQIGLVCSCMTHAWVAVPDTQLLHQLEMLTAGTTAASMLAYVWTYATGKLVPPMQAPGITKP